MQALLIKMSSMGDILHTFPALTDLQRHRPDVRLHWVVEQPFAAMAAWHPKVEQVIPVAQRQWLRNRDRAALAAYRQWRRDLRHTTYDLVLDSQNLIKSAFFARQARRRGELHGRHGADIREKPAAWLYSRRHRVDPEQHAIAQARQLFALTFGYRVTGPPDFGIRTQLAERRPAPSEPGIMLIPGTTWPNKHWHPAHWQELTTRLLQLGYGVEIVWGSPAERRLAEQIAQQCPQAYVAPDRLSINAVAEQLVHARAVIGMDTGFSHIAAALGTPTTALFGPTSPAYYGVTGPAARNLTLELDCQPCHKRQCRFLEPGSTATAPCLARLTPDQVLAWDALPDTFRHTDNPRMIQSSQSPS